MRRRVTFSGILLLGLLGALHAVTVKASTTYQPSLWKLSSAGNALYLLGSIHIGTPDMYPLPEAIEQAFAASPVLLVETYSNSSDKPGDTDQDLLREKGLYPPHDSLWKHISKETRRRLTDFWKKNPYLKEIGVGLRDIARARPWAVAMLVGVAPALAGGMDADLGIDQHFISQAEHAGTARRIVGMETAEFQYRLLSGFSQDVQVKWLENALGIASGVDAIDKALVADRNEHFADVAEQYLKGSEQAFMVVGSAHVPGIVHLIEQRGYKAEEVAVSRSTERR